MGLPEYFFMDGDIYGAWYPCECFLFICVSFTGVTSGGDPLRWTQQQMKKKELGAPNVKVYKTRNLLTAKVRYSHKKQVKLSKTQIQQRARGLTSLPVPIYSDAYRHDHVTSSGNNY